MLVLVHGVPETAALWGAFRARIGVPSLALAMPGFGCARPAGFAATKDAYVAWLVQQLDRLDEPADLLGHDWGAALTYRVATAHGDRLRSWVADVANVMHPDHRWHDLARIWQTPGEGEAFFRRQQATLVEERAAVFEAWGVPHDDAVDLAGASDETMASCILDLYRSALPNPHAHWHDGWGRTSAPGLVLFPSQDPFGDEDQSRQVAGMLGARHETLPGVGHWWPLQATGAAATVVGDFVSSAH